MMERVALVERVGCATLHDLGGARCGGDVGRPKNARRTPDVEVLVFDVPVVWCAA